MRYSTVQAEEMVCWISISSGKVWLLIIPNYPVAAGIIKIIIIIIQYISIENYSLQTSFTHIAAFIFHQSKWKAKIENYANIPWRVRVVDKAKWRVCVCYTPAFTCWVKKSSFKTKQNNIFLRKTVNTFLSLWYLPEFNYHLQLKRYVWEAPPNYHLKKKKLLYSSFHLLPQ